MRNPVFARSTVFTDQANSGSVSNYVGQGDIRLSGGERLVALDQPVPMLRIITRSGLVLDMSAETALALEKDEMGSPTIWRPVVAAETMPAIWNMTLDHPEYETYRHYVAGLVAGSGQHLTMQNRASFLNAPRAVVAEVEDLILKLGPEMTQRKLCHEYSNRHSVLDRGDGLFYLRSRVLSVLCTGLLEPKTQELLFDLNSTSFRLVWAFCRGLLSTLTTGKNGSITLWHRSADAIEAVAEALWVRFGVPCQVNINHDAPKLLPNSGPRSGHHLRLSADQVNYAVAAGLRDGRFDIAYTARPIPDPIVDVSLLDDPQPALLVAGSVECRSDRRYPLTANTLVFSPTFSMPSALADHNTGPTLESDPADF